MKIDVRIIINYKTKNSSPQTLRLKPEEYFDSLDEDETYESDGVPKFNDTRQYLTLELTEIEWTELCLTETKEERIIRSDFYGDGKIIMHQRKDIDGYEEIIIDTQITDTEAHIIRLPKDKDSGFWKICFNGKIEDLADGSQKETKYL